MTTKTQKSINSPLASAFNNIVSLNKSKSSMKSTRDSYNRFLNFMNVEIRNIDSIKLPKKKDIKKLSTLNVASTFGSAGSLLSSLASGALDVAGFVGDFFGGRKRGGGKPNPKAGGAIPKGKGIKLGGFRALGVANALFAGLDFATGLAEGESVGKAAAGAGGALAGSLIGGAIGQALIPVPGLGFVVGSMAGNFLGGFLGDRAHESITGEQSLEEKTKKRLKEQEVKQREAAKITRLTLPEVLDKFEQVVYKFENSMQNIAMQPYDESISEWEMGETKEDEIDYRPDGSEEFTPTGTGEEVFPLVGGKPSFTMGAGTFTAPRRGRIHNAQDIGVDPNTPVVASRSGKVLQSYSSGYGDVGGAVVIRYDNGQQGLYGHVTPNVKVGDTIQAGQNIARVTPDGNNTHLHYMRKDTRGNYIDPLPLLQKSKSGVPIVKGQKEEKQSELEKQSVFSKDTGDMKPKDYDKTKQSQEIVKPIASRTSSFSTPLSSVMQQSIASQQSPQYIQDFITTNSEKESQVIAMPTQIVLPQQLEQYPDYNQPQSSITFIPIISQSSGQSRPIVISGGGGGGGGSQTIIMPPPPTGQVLNSLFKTMLLTNLSAT
jgi:murein DD-endopeptidase MepM/ murein hydrolase activator NlpD